MRNSQKKYHLLILAMLVAANFGFSYQNEQEQQETKVNKIFENIEKGIHEGDIELFSEYFSENTFLSLRNSANGYFSINQAHYVLKDFFSIHKTVSFRFNNKVTDSNQPYGTGLFVFTKKGKRDSAVIYISLKKIKQTWEISQLSIN